MKLQLDYLFDQYGRGYQSFPPPETTLTPEDFFIACDESVFMLEEADNLTEAVRLFTEVAEGMVALYLIRNGEVLATYNGGQTDPEMELTYHVTKSDFTEWFWALAQLPGDG